MKHSEGASAKCSLCLLWWWEWCLANEVESSSNVETNDEKIIFLEAKISWYQKIAKEQVNLNARCFLSTWSRTLFVSSLLRMREEFVRVHSPFFMNRPPVHINGNPPRHTPEYPGCGKEIDIRVTCYIISIEIPEVSWSLVLQQVVISYQYFFFCEEKKENNKYQ